MVTKKQVAEQINLLLGKATPDFRVDERELMLAVGQERDAMLHVEYLNSMAQDMRDIPAEWLTTAIVAVQYDTVRQRDYVQLPYEPLSLPHGVGLHSIAPATDEFNVYVPTRPGDLGLLVNHQAFDTAGRAAYWPEMGAEGQPMRALFREPVRATHPNALVKLVAPSASIADTAPFPIPGHLLTVLVDKVRQKYATKPEADVTNDRRDQQ